MAAFTTQQLLAIALCHHRDGRVADAEGLYRQIIANDRRSAAAHDRLGVLLLQTNRPAPALPLLHRAAALEPASAAILCNLGECQRRMSQLADAVATLRSAIELDSNLPTARNNLGLALADMGLLEEAADAYQAAIALDPQLAKAHSNLANVMKELGRLNEALAAAERAASLDASSAEGHNNHAAVLSRVGRKHEAIAAYRRAVALRPSYGEAWSNLANALSAVGKHDESVATHRQAIAIDPSAVQSHWNYAVELLRTGELLDGWREYEWRWLPPPTFPRIARRFQPSPFSAPAWRGADLTGKVIFLHAEQGFGDAIQFCRYAPLVARRGGRVVLEVHAELRRLMETLDGVDHVMARGDALPDFAEHCPLMSLPLAFGTTVETIPADGPYLKADARLATQWAKRLRSISSPRVGLCWAGSPTHGDDRDRSIPLHLLSPLAAAGAAFVCLQMGPATEQAVGRIVLADAEHELPRPLASGPLQLFDPSPLILDFADTAAVIANLDLVITVDTAVAHLAGAMGKPTWVLLAAHAEWRWLLRRDDSPWYPTIRLFRQTSPGDWDDVIRRVGLALSEFSASQKPLAAP